jgi:hypothetical protein
LILGHIPLENPSQEATPNALACWIIEDYLQPLAEMRGESSNPTTINQADFNHVLQMNLVFSSVRIQFHSYQGLERNRIEVVGS